MEENQNEPVNDEQKPEETTSGFNLSSEEMKKEAEETVKQVKETIKNADLKKDTEAAKGFFAKFFKNPLEELRKVASDNKNSFLKIAIIVLIVWLIAVFACQVILIAKQYLFGTFGSFSYFFRNLLPNAFDIIKAVIAPIISLVVLSGLVYGFSKKKDKSLLNIASTIVISYIPVIISQISNLLLVFGSGVSRIISHFSSWCNILFAVLLYFAVKYLSNEEENKSYFWKFALIMGIFYVIKFVFSYLGIYL